MVELRVVGNLWENVEPHQVLDLEGHEVTVADLLTRLGIDPAEVGIVTVDGRQSKHDTVLPADGRVFIFPPMLGG